MVLSLCRGFRCEGRGAALSIDECTSVWLGERMALRLTNWAWNAGPAVATTWSHSVDGEGHALMLVACWISEGAVEVVAPTERMW